MPLNTNAIWSTEFGISKKIFSVDASYDWIIISHLSNSFAYFSTQADYSVEEKIKYELKYLLYLFHFPTFNQLSPVRSTRKSLLKEYNFSILFITWEYIKVNTH